jgi:ElaB/YqjD/DUF883 family membrane-anchored ribosome-binding protein
LDKAESLLRNAQKSLAMEDYAHAAVLAEQANRAADSAVTWLVIPVVAASAAVAASLGLLLRRKRKRSKT